MTFAKSVCECGRPIRSDNESGFCRKCRYRLSSSRRTGVEKYGPFEALPESVKVRSNPFKEIDQAIREAR